MSDMREKSATLASVVMPCRNVARWLPRCLEDVFAALPADCEVIAVDDGSTDETGAILDAAAKTRRDMRVLHSVHRGVSAARNAALDLSRGEYVFFVDPDDGVEPDFFTAAIDALRRDGAECCIVAYKTRMDGSDEFKVEPLKGDYRFDGNAAIVAGFLPRIFGYSFDDVREWYGGKELFRDREMAAVWRMAYRRELLERAGARFDETIELYEDMVFNVDCLLAARSMTCVDRPLYKVTERESGAMRTVPREGGRYCRNKLRLLAARKRLDVKSGGVLEPLYRGSCVLAAMEILSYTVRRKVAFGEGLGILREYLGDETVRRALRGFPLSWRRPAVAAAAVVLRLLT